MVSGSMRTRVQRPDRLKSPVAQALATILGRFFSAPSWHRADFAHSRAEWDLFGKARADVEVDAYTEEFEA